MADTPDQRPDDTNADPDRSELPSDLWPLHERLIADGERWRRRAPDGRDLLAWARATLLAAPSSAEPANTPKLRERWLDAQDEHLSQPKGPRVPMESPNDTRRARWRGVAGALAVTVVVGLLVALLVHNAAQRGAGASTTSTATATSRLAATPTPPDASGNNPTNFVQSSQLPVVAVRDTQIAYRVDTNNQVQRSTDGGKHFTPTTQPKTGLSNIGFTGLAVSPLNASTVFFNAGGQKNGQGCSPGQSYGALTQHSGGLMSGYVPCTAQLFSTDGGQTWRALKLPTGGVMGGPQGFRAMQQFYQNAQQYTIQAQGQRLYSAVAFANAGGSLIDSPGIRLVASDDGGATWKLIDSALVRSGNTIVCDFAAAPTGTTIYATTSPGSCGGMGTFPTITLWRSDNGGQSWRGPIRNLPTQAENGMVVSSQGWFYTFTPDVTAQGRGANATSSPASAVVSQDGGGRFTSAPSAGLPSGASLAGPFATLSDGSVVYALQGGDPATSANDTLYSWKPGASSWTKLTGAIANGVNAVIVTPASTGGDTLTIITDAGSVISLTTPN